MEVCRARRDPEQSKGKGGPGLCRDDTGDYLVFLSSGFLSSEKPEKDSSSEGGVGQSKLFPLIIKATLYGVSFASQGRAGDRVPSSSGLSDAEGLGLTAAAAGARREWTRDNSPAVSGVLPPCLEPRSAHGFSVGWLPGARGA